MKFSTKTRYGIRAMIEIAMDIEQHGVFQKDIAVNQNISVKYLDQIIPSLKVAGLIINLRGKKSGYILTRKPADITIYDIHRAFEPLIIVDCLEHKANCNRLEGCVARNFWCGLNDHITNYLKSITLQNLIDQQAELEMPSNKKRII